MPIIISIFTFVSTLLGGLFALRFKDKLHLILGFSAGAVIGVAFFDLLPESLQLAGGMSGASVITSIAAAGFFAYMVLDRLVILYSRDNENAHGTSHRGALGAGSLSIHSLLDGVAIGLAFQVSVAIGVVVAVAVLVHDFSDGINTVSLVIHGGGGRREAVRWLVLDAIAPLLGVVSTLFFTLPENVLGVILAVFSGFFLYIGACDLLPESQHSHPTIWTSLATVLGSVVIFAAIRLASF